MASINHATFECHKSVDALINARFAERKSGQHNENNKVSDFIDCQNIENFFSR